MVRVDNIAVLRYNVSETHSLASLGGHSNKEETRCHEQSFR